MRDIVERLRDEIDHTGITETTEGQRTTCPCTNCHRWRLATDSLAEVERLRGENMCDACAGQGVPVSGRPCMCGGSGKKTDAVDLLREELFDVHRRNERLTAALEQCDQAAADCTVPEAMMRHNIGGIARRALYREADHE